MRNNRIKEFFEYIGYPPEWLEEGEQYDSDKSYLAFDPKWSTEKMPPLPEEPVYSILLNQKESEKTALICLGKETSYRELNEMSDRLAGKLSDMGVKKGDRVATLLPNCTQHSIAFFAIAKLGGICVPNNVMYTPRELEYQLNDSEVKILITLDALYPIYEKVNKSAIENVIVTNIEDFAAPDENIPPNLKVENKEIPGTYPLSEILQNQIPVEKYANINPDEDICLMIYTSGTTGSPKGVMSSHKNLWANIWVVKYGIGITDRDINMQIMPTFHCSGWDLPQLPALYAGGIVVHVPIFEAESSLKILQDYRVSVVFAPPTFFLGLLNHSNFKKYNLSNLRIPLSCGAPLPYIVKEDWDKLTGTYLYEGYGLTETNCGGVSCLNFPNKRKPGCIGTVTLGEMKIINEKEEVVPRRIVGEILFRGFGVARGYWNKPEETKKNFREDGWFHTGDAGYLDEEGFVYFVDRYKDIIIASGYNVAPYEVEDIIMKHPAVKEAAVVGKPDTYRGETIKAFISLKDNYKNTISEEDITAYCRENLAKFKIPREIEFIEEIPKNAVGKVLRRKLREYSEK